MPTAHHQLTRLLSEHVTPLLVRRGFKRYGRRWGKLTPDGWLVVDVQRSQWSSRNDITFTLNFGFQSELISGLLRRPFREDIPPAVTKCDLALRPSNLKVGKTDWWEVTNKHDPAVGRAVERALAARVPIFVRRESTNKRLLVWDKRYGFLHSGWQASVALVLCLRGRAEFRRRAEAILDALPSSERRRARAALRAIEERGRQSRAKRSTVLR